MKCSESIQQIAIERFGQQSTDYFEQSVRTGKYDLNYRSNKNRGTILHYAALIGDLNLVKELVRLGADVKVTDNYYRSVVHYAAESGNPDLIQWLVEHGANVNAKNNEGDTALHYVAQNGNLEFVKWLVENGADVNAKTKFDGYTALHYATQNSNLELVKWLVEHGADINARNSNDMSILDCAIGSNSNTLTQWQKEHGAKKV